MRARHCPLVALLVAMAAPAACSSASSPPPHPARTVDCHAPPPSSVTGPACAGLCIDSASCGDAASYGCPAGFLDTGIRGCPNSARCCAAVRDAGADGASEAGVDGAPEGGADAGSDGASADASPE